MKPLIVAIPSYNRPEKLARTVEGIQRELHPHDVVVYEQAAGKPAGLGKAWHTVTKMAAAAYGPNAFYLLLDDDCHFPIIGDFHHALRHFDDDPLLGVVQVQAREGPISPRGTVLPFVMHAFLVRGQVLWPSAAGEGVNYDPRETVSIEVGMSLDVGFAGWRQLRTQRVRIVREMVPRADDKNQKEHYATPKYDGGIEGSVKDGAPVVCTFKERFVDTGLVTCSWYSRRGVLIPNYPSVKLTQRGKLRVKKALATRAMVLQVHP
jgi:hypothetical protein